MNHHTNTKPEGNRLRTGVNREAWLLTLIKKLVYTGGTNDLHTRHNKATDNKAMVHVNLMNLHQDRIQNIQEFRDESLTMKKVCAKLKLHFGMCESDARVILKEKGVTNSTDVQLMKAVVQIEEEHHAIMFLYEVDRQKI